MKFGNSGCKVRSSSRTLAGPQQFGLINQNTYKNKKGSIQRNINMDLYKVKQLMDNKEDPKT